MHIKRRRPVLILVIVAVFGTIATLGGAAGPAYAGPGDRNFYPTRAVDQCLDIGSNSPRTSVGLYYCNSNAESQDWYWAPNTGLMSSASSGYRLCWDLRSYGQGSIVILNWCDPNLVSQRWSYSTANLQLASVGSHYQMCIDLRSYAPTTPAGLNYCSGDLASQRFLSNIK